MKIIGFAQYYLESERDRERYMGVRGIGTFKMAMLGKWKWRLLNDKNLIWYKVLKCKYGVQGKITFKGTK